MEGILDGLTEAQRLAVTTAAGRLRILAGAGSGKTRVLTRRIAHGAASYTIAAEHTLALTFTRKAAGELRTRLRSLGLRDSVTAGTFHATALAQLRSRWADRGIRPPELLDRRGRLLHQVLPRSMERAERLAVMAEIDWATARRIGPAAYPAAAERADRRLPVTGAQIAQYMRDFADLKQRRRTVDFDDLLELCIRDLADPDLARVRHWRYRHLFVDEFQDVNPLQFDLLRAWLGPQGTLCVVGDPRQAIYAWNGADATYLEHFPALFPGAQTVELDDNFRSTPQILDAAARVLGGGRLRAHRPDGPLPVVMACADEVDEAHAVARRVRDRHTPGGRWSRQAVLVRTNAQTGLIADALRAAKVPVAIREGASLLDDPRVADRMHELGAAAVPLSTALNDLRLDARETDDEAAQDALEALATLADDHLSVHPDATSVDFVGWARSALASESGPGDRDAVQIMTFHAAKGLEWPVVHIAGVEDGLVPIARATTADARAEELRLFYVAITRAEDELSCTWARRRRFGERTTERRMSPLLDRMLAVSEAPTVEAERSQRNAARVRDIRTSLGFTDGTTDEMPPDLREQIRSWRREAARSAGVPAYVVVGDRTVDAIVANRPCTHDDLLAIPGMGPVKVARYGDQLLALVSGSTTDS